MLEAGVLIVNGDPVYWHLPWGRTSGSLPDSRTLWDVFWEHRQAPALGFAHSHPGSGTPAPSLTDLTTFSAVELGLGRRLLWWITSSDQVISLIWKGPSPYVYTGQLISEPAWAPKLRALSKEEDHGN